MDAAVWRPRFNPWLIALTVTLATFMEVLDTSCLLYTSLLGERDELGVRQAEGRSFGIFGEQVGVKQSRIVGGKSNEQAAFQERRQGMIL